jgi:hypothetical protein
MGPTLSAGNAGRILDSGSKSGRTVTKRPGRSICENCYKTDVHWVTLHVQAIHRGPMCSNTVYEWSLVDLVRRIRMQVWWWARQCYCDSNLNMVLRRVSCFRRLALMWEP